MIMFVALTLVILTGVPALAEDQSITWSYDGSRVRYATRYFKVGDALTFEWGGGNHDVQLHAENNCDTNEADELIEATDVSSTTFVYNFAETGDFYFACDVGPHCSSGGMLIAATVCSSFLRLLHWIIMILTLGIVRLGCETV